MIPFLFPIQTAQPLNDFVELLFDWYETHALLTLAGGFWNQEVPLASAFPFAVFYPGRDDYEHSIGRDAKVVIPCQISMFFDQGSGMSQARKNWRDSLFGDSGLQSRLRSYSFGDGSKGVSVSLSRVVKRKDMIGSKNGKNVWITDFLFEVVLGDVL